MTKNTGMDNLVFQNLKMKIVTIVTAAQSRYVYKKREKKVKVNRGIIKTIRALSLHKLLNEIQ